MDKIIPIKVEKYVPIAFKSFQWKIHNVCNYNCSFCDSTNKSGSQRWFKLDQYYKYIDKLHELSKGMPYWFQFTGGEPTLFPHFIELTKYAKNKGANVGVCTNGIRSLRWWEEIKNEKTLDFLFLTYHSEQTNDYKHIADVVNLFHDQTTRTVVAVTHVYNSFSIAVEAHSYLLENTGAIVNLKAMYIDNIYNIYTPEELNYLLKNNYKLGKLNNSKKKSDLSDDLLIRHTLKVTHNNNDVTKVDPQYLVKTQKNKFTGWDCEIGYHNMRIDYDIVHRGVCEVGDARNLDDENLSFSTDTVSCTRPECFCNADLVATKYRPKHLFQ